jgi:HrpA-like RNA helicase
MPIAIRKDILRRKEMKYGRRLKGPVFVTPKQFNKAIQGTGIGLKVNRCREILRVPLRAEDQHFEIIGDTGSGKTTIIMQMLRQIQARGHSAISTTHYVGGVPDNSFFRRSKEELNS